MVGFDQYLSDIVVVAEDSQTLDKLSEDLRARGVEIRNVDKDNGVIEATAPSYLVKAIDDDPGVAYVRTVFTYAADFPPGDPRNR